MNNNSVSGKISHTIEVWADWIPKNKDANIIMRFIRTVANKILLEAGNWPDKRTIPYISDRELKVKISEFAEKEWFRYFVEMINETWNLDAVYVYNQDKPMKENMCYNNYTTPLLHIVIMNWYTDLALQLIDHWADPNVSWPYVWYTAYWFAKLWNNPKLAKLIYNHPAYKIKFRDAVEIFKKKIIFTLKGIEAK